MTIQHSIDIMQAWTHGLRIAMGYPEYAPIGNPVAFASGGRKNFAKALEIAAIVEQTGRDMVLVQFGLPIADGPIGVSLAARANLHVNWHADVQLYLARCLIPRFDGAILSLEWREAIWDRYVTGAPRPRTPSEQQYSDRKLRSRR